MNNKDTQQEIDLGGQVAIVTGGGRGIGRAVGAGARQCRCGGGCGRSLC